MKNLLAASTRFGSRCRRAAVLLGVLLLVGLYALLSAILPGLLLIGVLALIHPADAQRVQAMVKNQPFPYKTGIAMDSTLYSAVKAKLQAAEQLRETSRKAVDSLKKEVLLTRKALDDQARLSHYDQHKSEGLITQMNQLQQQLATAQADVKRADELVASVLAELPRRLRKDLKSAPAGVVAAATVNYVQTLQHRKWTWSGVSATAGILLGILLAF